MKSVTMFAVQHQILAPPVYSGGNSHFTFYLLKHINRR